MFHFFPGRKQSVDWLKSSDDLTLVTNVIAGSSPIPEVRGAETWERRCQQQVHARAKLRLIEEVDILQDDTAGKRFTVSGPLNEELHGLHYRKCNCGLYSIALLRQFNVALEISPKRFNSSMTYSNMFSNRFAVVPLHLSTTITVTSE